MLQVINIKVNGKDHEIAIDQRKSLLEVLRVDLGLTGAKKGCGVGECGACAVLVDGVSMDSCIYLGVWADGKSITTIEGIQGEDGSLSNLQQQFIDKGAVQCGFCTPGLIISATSLLENKKGLSRDEIRRGLSGNLCRCTGYQKIVEAVEAADKER